MGRRARSAWGFASLVLGAAVLAGGAGGAERTFPGRLGPIAFESAASGTGDLWLLDSKTKQTTRLTNTPGDDDSVPAWSPALGEDVLAYASTRNGNTDVYSFNVDANEQTQLTTNAATDTEPAWSPDEGDPHIVFVSTRDGNREIYTMDGSGGSVRRLTASPANDVEPEWSPDGNEIVFASDRDGPFHLYAMKTDGSGVRAITRSSQN